MAEYAVCFSGRERAELVEVATSQEAVGESEVCGPTVATLVSAGTELACYQGHLHSGEFPMWPGYAAVFRVEQTGSAVDTLKPGDLAFCMGGHRSWQCVPAHEALRLPEGLSPHDALFARMMGITMSTLTTTTARPPGKVLVIGLGPVGHLAAKVFQVCGYQIHACDPDEARRELARQAGLSNISAHVPVEDPQVAGQVDLVLECSGREEPTLQACRIVRKRGEIVLVGVPWRETSDLSAHELLHAIFHNYAVVRSGWEWEVARHPTDFRTNSQYGNFAAALEWLAEGRVRAAGLYEVASPKNAQEVYQGLAQGRCKRLTVVFDWNRGIE